MVDIEIVNSLYFLHANQTLVASYLHRYTLGHKKNIFAWGTRGSVWSSVRNLMDGQTIGKPTCQASDADISGASSEFAWTCKVMSFVGSFVRVWHCTGPMQSPLLQMRAGLIPSMFVESSSLLEYDENQRLFVRI
jgi:hypothetical protein